METVKPEDYNFVVREVVQITQIVLVGTADSGVEFEMVVASNRRSIPVPYSEEP